MQLQAVKGDVFRESGHYCFCEVADEVFAGWLEVNKYDVAVFFAEFQSFGGIVAQNESVVELVYYGLVYNGFKVAEIHDHSVLAV